MPQIPQELYINIWRTGLYTQRSPLVTPLASMGLQIIPRYDVLADGLNIEVSNSNTLVRRPAYTRFCSIQFSASNYPLNFYSFQKIDGTINLLADTPNNVYTFTTSTLSSIFTKGTTAQTRFQKVGNMLYFCDGTDLKKWDGTTVTNWGIVAPSTAPSLSFSTGSLSPASGYQYVYAFKNSSSGHISTASPVSANTGPRTSKNIGVSGDRSTDPQVDKIEIYRTNDGGSTFNFLAEISNPGAGTWSYTDSTADSGLNDFIQPAIDHINDPPPAGATDVKFHMGRMWLAVSNKVYFGAGGDTLVGVPEEAFPPANVFVFPGKVTALLSITPGLLVFTSDNIYIIGGGPDLLTFLSTLWLNNFGVKGPNCVAQDGDLFYIYTSRRQLWEISSSQAEVGFSIGDQLKANFDPTTSCLALHRNGSDAGLFISDGSANVYKYNIAFQCWSPVAQPTGGVGIISSIETSAANWSLLAGRTSGSGYIISRDLTSYTDDGGTYSAYATVGTTTLAQPGHTYPLDSILVERMPVGTAHTCAVLLNEVSGSFTTVPNPVADPWQLTASSTIISVRHDLKAATTPLPQLVRHLQVKITFASEAFKNEILGLAFKTMTA